MQNFFRSLKYLWPYRMRIALSVGCVLIIAAIWGMGFAASPVGLKILVDPEGLHGWAWRSLTDDKFDVTVVSRVVPEGVSINGQTPVTVLDVVKAGTESQALAAGIDGEWIVGLDDGDPDHLLLRSETLIRMLAQTPSNQTINLCMFNPYTDKSRIVELTATNANYKSELLGRLAAAIPEPETYAARFSLFVNLILIFWSSVLLRNVFRFCQEYLVQTAVRKGIVDLRCQTFSNAIRLPAPYYSASGTSDTTSRLSKDVNELARGQITLLGKTVLEPAKAFSTVVAALWLDWKLTLITFIAGPIAFIMIRLLGKLMKKASRKALESAAELLETTEETLTGIRVVKAYTMETRQRKEYYRTNRRLYKQQRRMGRVDALAGPVIESLGTTFVLLAAGCAGYYVFSDRMDPYVFIPWMGCLAGMFDPVRKLSKVFTRFQRAEAAAERVFEVCDRQPERRDPTAPKLPRHTKSIEFQDVCFRYNNADVNAVDHVDLTIAHDETIAVVGPNGCGKTTLLSLLPRLLEPTSGRILIDGQDILDSSLRSLREQIGLVTQDSMMFHATIADNIRFGKPGASDEEVHDAARRAHVDEFVTVMPEGYDTIIGQHGSTLSGGQKQRISIARAILRDPAILIFDEATSQIDAESEHRIAQTVGEFIVGRTTLMIAHRFATVMAADRIVVMDAGRVVDIGSHDQLIARCDLYKTLYNTQFMDASGE
jgi:subfamily B ATP-binding cassette protein MsbA